LLYFVKDNKTNQDILHPRIFQLSQYIKKGNDSNNNGFPIAAHLIKEIYAENILYLNSLSTIYLTKVAEKMEKLERDKFEKSYLLTVLSGLIKFNGNIIKKNQTQIVNVITNNI